MLEDEEKPFDKHHAKHWSTRIWLIGAFFQKETSGRASAFYEVIFGILIGTLPFWVGGIVLLVRDTSSVGGPEISFLAKYWSATQKTFERGELLIFAVSFLAPAFWLAAHEPEGAKTLPHRRPIVSLSFTIIAVGIALFSLIQSGTSVNMPAIYTVSLWMAAAAVLIMYLALTYHSFRLPRANLTEKDLTKSRETFFEEYSRHREKINGEH